MAQARLCPACRKTRLSRYNPDPLCAPCTRAARTTPALAERGAPTWLWDSPPMRDALARVDLAAAVAVFRAAAGLSQHELADITGWSQSSLSLFESGHRDTLYDVRALLRFADAVDMPREALLPVVLGTAGATLPDAWLAEMSVAEGSVLEESGVDRRSFGGLAAGALAGAMLPEITVPSKVTSAHVRYLRTCVDNLYSRDLTVGGGALVRQAVRQWRRARRMLDDSTYSDAVGRQLLGVVGDLAVCAGWLAVDGGNPPLARWLFSEAQLLASSAGDPIRTVQVLVHWSGLSSFVARTDRKSGPAREALRLAQQAAEEARSVPSPRLRALVALRHANATSLLGDDLGFRAAISRARRELDRGPRADDPEMAQRTNESEIAIVEGMGYMNLGEPARGEELYRRLLGSELSPMARTYVGSLLADSLIRQDARNDAIQAGLDVLDMLTDGMTSGRSLSQLRPVRVAALQTKAEEFCARFDAAERALTAM